MLTNKIGLICLLTATAFLAQSCRESTLYPNYNPGPDINPANIAVADVYGVEWELEAFENWNDGTMFRESGVPDGQRYSLTFRQEGLGGDNYCNAYKAEYALGANNTISVSNILSTKVQCGPNSRDIEFSDVLKHAVRYEINSTTLRIVAQEMDITFNSSGVNALRFRRVSPQAIQLAPLEIMDLASSDPYSILSAEIQGDLLRLIVQYGGGCNDHTFTLMGPTTILPGEPTRVTVLLYHNANNDGCEALITRDLAFDLAPLKERWKSVTGRSSGTIALTLNDLHARVIGPMTYAVGNGNSTIPDWLQDTIAAIESRPVTTPAESIVQYLYNGITVYYRPPVCCDALSDLYGVDGNLLCHPDGGITGAGDGTCSDFISGRTNGNLIWQDPR